MAKRPAARGKARGSAKGRAPARAVAASPHANKVARWAFGGFVVIVILGTVIALDLPNKAALATGEAVGDAGFRVRSVDVQGLNRMDPAPVYEIATSQKTTALPLVDVAEIRSQLLGFGWVKDARVSRRYPDTLVVDIVERTPAALWQDRERLNLIDAGGVVLDRVPVSEMPDLPLLVGDQANRHAAALGDMLGKAPSIKNQLVSAQWVGGRRWDLKVESGEVISLPEGDQAAASALVKFAQMDKASGLLGRGLVRFDLRLPGKMVVRLPRAPGEPIVPKPATES